MCKYCDKHQNVESSTCTSLSLNITDSKSIAINYEAYSCDSSFYEEEFPINYCPFCGKKL